MGHLGLYADFTSLSWLNWNFEMLVFAEGGKPEKPEKAPQRRARTNNKPKTHMALGYIQSKCSY